MQRSLRSQLILASVLWTGGLLSLLHLASIVMMHALPFLRGSRLLPLLIGVMLMTAGLLVARRSLSPFRLLREQLTDLRAGRLNRARGDFPQEVRPLVEELNALLADRERALERAQATAGDLAHGLKTPLALLAHEAQGARAAGATEMADRLTGHVERMSRLVSYHLARARAEASGGAAVPPWPLRDCIEPLLRTMEKLHAGRGLRIAARVAGDPQTRVRREELDEILGNLLDNACKWAASTVSLHVETRAGLAIHIDDDGPGIAPDRRVAVLERGVRADQAAPGSGLGLAIVRDLVEIHGGRLVLTQSPAGGLRATVQLPGAVTMAG